MFIYNAIWYNKNMNIALLGNGHVCRALLDIIDKENNLLYLYSRSKAVFNNIYFYLESSDFNNIANNKEIDLVIDMLGDNDIAVEMSKNIIKQSLLNNKSVIACSKKLMNKYGEELCNYAKDTNGELYINSLVSSSKDFMPYPEYLSIDNFLNASDKNHILKYRGGGPIETAQYINDEILKIKEIKKCKVNSWPLA